MLVKDLIEELKKCPPDTDVCVLNPKWNLTPYISMWDTYMSGRRVLLLVGDCEDTEERRKERGEL